MNRYLPPIVLLCFLLAFVSAKEKDPLDGGIITIPDPEATLDMSWGDCSESSVFIMDSPVSGHLTCNMRIRGNDAPIRLDTDNLSVRAITGSISSSKALRREIITETIPTYTLREVCENRTTINDSKSLTKEVCTYERIRTGERQVDKVVERKSKENLDEDDEITITFNINVPAGSSGKADLVVPFYYQGERHEFRLDPFWNSTITPSHPYWNQTSETGGLINGRYCRSLSFVKQGSETIVSIAYMSGAEMGNISADIVVSILTNNSGSPGVALAHATFSQANVETFANLTATLNESVDLVDQTSYWIVYSSPTGPAEELNGYSTYRLTGDPNPGSDSKYGTDYVGDTCTTWGDDSPYDYTYMMFTDTTSPTISWNWTDQNSTTNYNSTYIGITTDEDAYCNLNLNGTSLWDDLISYYHFDNDYNDYIRSNDGTTTGAVNLSVAGVIGQSASFDGYNDYITLLNTQSNGSNALILNNSFSIAMWANSRESKSSYVVNNYDNADGHFINLDSNPNGAGIDYRIYIDDDISPAQATTGELGLNSWHHIVATRDEGTSVSIYVDGKLVDSTSDTTTTRITNTENPWAIGRSADANAEYYNGSLDELMLFNRSLSASEIQSLYASTGQAHYYNATNLENGNYSSIDWTCYDIMNNSAESTTAWWDIDTTSPTITWNWADQNSTTRYNSTYIGVTSNEDSYCNLNLNGTSLWDGLVSYYHFDNDYTDSIGLTSATSEGNLRLSEDGYVGQSARFDGVDSAARITGASSSFSGDNSSFTFLTWLYPRQLPSNRGGSQYIYSKDNNNRMLWLSANNYLYLGGNDYFQATPTVNTWNHLALTCTGDTSTCTLYLNNVPKSINLQDGASTISAWGDFSLGKAGVSNYLNGSIDEVMLFNRSLSASEIQSLYATTGQAHYYNATNLENGNYSSIDWTCYDIANNSAESTTAWWDIDTNSPTVSWNWTDQNSTTTYNSTTLQVNLSETGNCTFYVNGTAYANATSGTEISYNLTSFSRGNYTIYATCSDASGNKANSTLAWWEIQSYLAQITDANLTITLPSEEDAGDPFNITWTITIGKDLAEDLDVKIVNLYPLDCRLRAGESDTWNYTNINGTLTSSTQYICDNPDTEPYEFNLDVNFTNDSGRFNASISGGILIPTAKPKPPDGGGGGAPIEEEPPKNMTIEQPVGGDDSKKVQEEGKTIFSLNVQEWILVIWIALWILLMLYLLLDALKRN